MEFYFVRSRGWRTGLVIARSNLHAVEVAALTGIHRRGKRVVVYHVHAETVPESIRGWAGFGTPGRVLFPSLFRRFPLLLEV